VRFEGYTIFGIGVDRKHTFKWLFAQVESTSNPNTVHLSILIAFWMLIGGRGLQCRGRIGKLLILRLTPRKLRRLRLDTTRSSSISPSTAL